MMGALRLTDFTAALAEVPNPALARHYDMIEVCGSVCLLICHVSNLLLGQGRFEGAQPGAGAPLRYDRGACVWLCVDMLCVY